MGLELPQTKPGIPWRIFLASVGMAFLASFLISFFSSLETTWDDALVKELASEHRQWVTSHFQRTSSPHPLAGIVILVTGSTSGIGRSLVRWNHAQGATVVAMGRSRSKLTSLQTELDKEGSSRFIPIVADMSDLKSVSMALDGLQQQDDLRSISRIDIVVCNAGIWESYRKDAPSSTQQGYDLTFGVNYLSHVLLTEKLMKMRTNNNTMLLLSPETSRIVQVSSSFHMGVDGSDLQVHKHEDTRSPIASRRPNKGNWFDDFFTGQRQYANSKLAQLLYARASNRVSKVPVLSACPGWVGTHILRSKLPTKSWAEKLFYTLSFDSDGYALSSILKAMFVPFSNPSKSEDYFPNFGASLALLGYIADQLLVQMDRLLVGCQRREILARYLRDIVSIVGAGFVMVVQRWFPTADRKEAWFTYQSSSASYNMTLQQELYEWSLEAIADFL